MATQKTQIRKRLGAEIARLRDRHGMPKQADLARRAAVGLRTIVAVEGGDKVSDKTLAKVESVFPDLPPGTFDAYLEGKIRSLIPGEAPVIPEPGEDLGPRQPVLDASNVDDLIGMAKQYAWQKAGGAEPDSRDEERYLAWALQVRRERDIEPPSPQGREVS